MNKALIFCLPGIYLTGFFCIKEKEQYLCKLKPQNKTTFIDYKKGSFTNPAFIFRQKYFQLFLRYALVVFENISDGNTGFVKEGKKNTTS